MTLFSKIQDRLRHAFAVRTPGPLEASDLALLERAAEVIVRRGMGAPACLFLESVGPMNFLGSQALHFFTPLLDLVFPQREIERIATLLERRDALSRLAEIIERRSESPRTADAR